MAEFSGDDHVVAARLATMAGELLLRIRAGGGTDLRDAGDRGAHDFLMAALARARPGDAVLSEEGADDLARLDADRVWIVDPLDGTREFGEQGRPDWAVHVALWQRDLPGADGPRGSLRAGAVALPARGITLSTAPAGARIGDLPLTIGAPEPGRIRIAVSRTRPPVFVQRMAENLAAEVELVPIGSAGAKISAVLLGEVDAYVHAGGQYEWDSAAPAAVALASGAHASRIDGTELAYNQKDTRLPDILVCHPSLASMLLAGIREVSDALPG
jgi:3'(2'), 5'-bisphosphate nucleotidase